MTLYFEINAMNKQWRQRQKIAEILNAVVKNI